MGNEKETAKGHGSISPTNRGSISPTNNASIPELLWDGGDIEKWHKEVDEKLREALEKDLMIEYIEKNINFASK